MIKNNFAKQLLKWFELHGRKNLPWQHNLNPYRVWISEIMLQQTQVNTVIPYFERFMLRFPCIDKLALAEQDEVLHYWSGLGYYSRARNLHKTAQQVMANFKGQLPDGSDQLQSLPGIGRSTAGAILAIAFEQPASILDGNVKRVLARHDAIDGWPGNTAVSKQLWEIAERLTPKQQVRAYTQAIMDLGATLCTRSKPQCEACPVAVSCKAKAYDAIALYPGKKPKKVLPVKATEMLIIENQDGHVLLEKRPPTGIWGGLWSLPEQRSALDTNLVASKPQCWPVVRHTFSHFHLDITPVHHKLKANNTARQNAVMEVNNQLWYNIKQPKAIGLAAPVSKLLRALQTNKQSL